MNKYLLDTNVVIGLWKQYPSIINKLIEDEKIIILKEVSEELVVKERKQYKGQQVLSERFCKLLFSIIEINKSNLEEFSSKLNIKYSKSGNIYLNSINKLSQNDLLLLYACHSDDSLILVTEDKYLYNAANQILGEDKVMTLNMMIEEQYSEVN
ncbi:MULTISPECIES: PIN domain-containing protein [Clostridium]|jgi:predicted nucleic acid-binding protein|uniref:Nucleic acid-binding protein n=2 Tax=Clostridium TaxID=1485 RepID=A0AAW3WFL0_CLOBE|nr:PIN domain-containing protein [Clostridium beijerinckii]MBC2460257.1 PIN domain-containing protein [Clostridium beijerinckii]MBC2477761.1 PIN domain-containing protein [Clostridium beijerinckii]MCI1579252.1 PIN domain-containing protein [Clostridium beijerinckii]MCI1585123.1 PIN domain-containing protein [Clostridium beijerinckii]MCI1622464.1 PIN domain-containing protein [Clostridium beijerinckii]